MTHAASIEETREARPPLRPSPDGAPAAGVCRQAAVLLRILALLDAASIPYCIVGGAERLQPTAEWSGDLDCVVPGAVVPRTIASLLREHAREIGAEVVQWHHVARHFNHYITLAALSESADPCFVNLDLHSGYVRDTFRFLDDEELLRTRRREGGVALPAADMGFAHRLLKRVLSRSLVETRGVGLTKLYAVDPAGCARQARRFCSASHSALIIEAAASGDWRRVIERLDEIDAVIRRRFILRNPGRVFAGGLTAAVTAARQSLAPARGLHAVLLGPDGVGKSTVIERLAPLLEPVFDHVESPTPAPAVLPWSNRGRLVGRPHALPPRPAYQSILKAGFWLVYYRLAHLRAVRPALRRGDLVLFHRSLLDALVDARRYRYGGPRALLRLVIRLLPRPDLVCVLDAPAEEIQRRKQEVPAAETARARDAYRALAASLPNAVVIDASGAPAVVARLVANAILRRATERMTEMRRA